MPVEWRPEARSGLREILSFLASRNPVAAFSLIDAIERATSALPQHPYLYRPGKVAETREIVVHPNYIVVYRIPFPRWRSSTFSIPASNTPDLVHLADMRSEPPVNFPGCGPQPAGVGFRKKRKGDTDDHLCAAASGDVRRRSRSDHLDDQPATECCGSLFELLEARPVMRVFQPLRGWP